MTSNAFSVEGCSLIVAVSIPLTRPLLIVVGHRFMEITSRLSMKLRSTNRSDRIISSSRSAPYQIQDSKDDIPLRHTQISLMASESTETDLRRRNDMDSPISGIRSDNDFFAQSERRDYP